VWFLLIVAGIFTAITAAGIIAARSERPEAIQRRLEAEHDALMRVPATPIAAVENGQRVRLRGRVVARGPLRTSPLSQRTCVGFHLTADSKQSAWHRWVDRKEFDSFVLTDGTGEAVLHPPFQLQLAPYDAATDSVPPALYDILTQAGANITFFGVPDQLRYSEILLQPGDEIIAVGRATIEIDPAGRSPSPRDLPIICDPKGADEPVVLADPEET
jgi:hypothetical protein